MKTEILIAAIQSLRPGIEISVATKQEATLADVTWPKDAVPPSQAEIDGVLASVHRRKALAAVNAAFEAAAARLIAGYPPSERLTWPIQEAEARAWRADPVAPTPYLDALAAGRGKSTADLVARVAANSAAWRAASAQLIAERHKGADAIAAAADEAGINAARDAAIAALGPQASAP